MGAGVIIAVKVKHVCGTQEECASIAIMNAGNWVPEPASFGAQPA